MTSKRDVTRKKRAVAIWLLIGVFMIMIQVIIGGITRLTGSGLSITEWDPIMGFIPPLNHDDWVAAFDSYQQIPQYKYLNRHFTLSDFKFIYLWEWFHRVWARTLGVVFVIPFIYFLVKKYFLNEMIMPLIILFLLGGLQGFIGWFMVQSGLGDSNLLNVSHIRLSIHFISALVLLVYTLWFALKLLIPEKKFVYDSKNKNYFLGLLGLLTVQLFYGAFMSGLQAARYAPSWPKINGFWFPRNMIGDSWINDPINVQFIHRSIAYILVVLIVIGFLKTRKIALANGSKLLRRAGSWPLILVSVQVGLGIYTLLAVPHIERGRFGLYETLAQTHQLVGMCLLISLIVIFYILRHSKKHQAV